MTPALPPIELLATALALLYVVLAARGSAWCWPPAFASSCLMAYRVFAAYDLYFDAALNAFYAAMAVVGLWRWTRGTPNAGEAPPITAMSWREHAAWIGGGAIVVAVGAGLAEAYTAAARPLADATTTVYSVIGTILLVERRLDNWLYFAAMDAVYVWLYHERGSALFAGLFAVYTVLAVIGYASWRRSMTAELNPNPAQADPLE